MAMSGAQNAAFTHATGHAPATVGTLISGIVLVLVFIWAAWLIARTLSAVTKDRAKESDLLWVGLRASALIAIALWLVN